jgi:hypothetical protein
MRIPEIILIGEAFVELVATKQSANVAMPSLGKAKQFQWKQK